MTCDFAGANAVYVTDLRGSLQYEFGGYGFHPGMFNNPAGITTDTHGNMLIADRRKNIVQV